MFSVHWQFFVYQHKYPLCVYVSNGIEKNSFFVMLVSTITVYISSYSLIAQMQGLCSLCKFYVSQ